MVTQSVRKNSPIVHRQAAIRSVQALMSKRVGPGVKWIIPRFRIFDAIGEQELTGYSPMGCAR